MLLKKVKSYNKEITINDLATVSGISTVRLYAINNNPSNRNIKLTTIEKIYTATKKLCGTGLLPNDYLVGCIIN